MQNAAERDAGVEHWVGEAEIMETNGDTHGRMARYAWSLASYEHGCLASAQILEDTGALCAAREIVRKCAPNTR